MENEGEFIERRLDEIFDEKPKKPDAPKLRHAVCTRCGAAFETTRPSAKLCRSCLSAARRVGGQKGGQAKRRTEPAPDPVPEIPIEEAAPEPVSMPEPEREPEYLTVRKLMELLAHVPDPERVPALLEERTFADSVELRSLWHVGGETEAVVIIRE